MRRKNREKIIPSRRLKYKYSKHNAVQDQFPRELLSSPMWMKQNLSGHNDHRRHPRIDLTRRMVFQQMSIQGWAGREKHSMTAFRTETLVTTEVLMPVCTGTENSPGQALGKVTKCPAPHFLH